MIEIKDFITGFVDVDKRNYHINTFETMVIEVEGIEYVLDYIDNKKQEGHTSEINKLTERTIERIHQIQKDIPDYEPYYKDVSKEQIEYYLMPSKQMIVNDLEQARRWVKNTLDAYYELQQFIPRLYQPYAAEDEGVSTSVPIDNLFIIPIALVITFVLISVIIYFIQL